jgi:two-component system, sensor histidine kinase and response regulator
VQIQVNGISGQENLMPGNECAVNIFPGHRSDEFQNKSFTDSVIDVKEGFSSLMEIIPFPLIITELISGKVLYANPKALELFEVDRTAFLSKDFFNYFVFPDDLSLALNEIQEAGKIEQREMQLYKENKVHFIGCVCAKLDNYDGKEVLVCTIKDISDDDNERLLEELEISKEQIEEEAANINRVNYQLEESQQKLQELNASKDKLLSIIGHDLRNPFFVISSYSEMLKDDYERLSHDERLNIINTIGETSRFAHRLLENLLNWARTQTGRMEYTPSALQVKKIVTSSIELVRLQAQKKNITIMTDVSVSLMVHADRNMLDTIIRNLVSNSIKFTEPGGFVKISATDFNEYIKITVSDTGIGMADVDLTKLFRIDTKNTEIGNSKEKGTGLGLILCKEFVERHGGSIWVESELGKGSQFMFTVPRIRTYA